MDFQGGSNKRVRTREVKPNVIKKGNDLAAILAKKDYMCEELYARYDE